MIIMLTSIMFICVMLYIGQIMIPFWLVFVTVFFSIIVYYMLILYRRRLIFDNELLRISGQALYEIPCSCVYNGYNVDCAKLFIYEYGIEYIDLEKFSYFGFIPFEDIKNVDLVEKQLQIVYSKFFGNCLLAFESDNLLDLQLIYEACISNAANFDDSFNAFAKDI